MTDDLTTLNARYEQIFQMAHLAVEPRLAGTQHAFMFEDHQITIIFPPLPAIDAPHGFGRRHAFKLDASIFMWKGDEPLGVDIGSIKLTVEGLQFTIPSAAAALSHIDITLFTEEQIRLLDGSSDKTHFLAERAINYWLRVIWWKTGFHTVNRLTGIARGGFDGGALINAGTATRFYTPRAGRTIVVPAQPLMNLAQWTEIDAALSAGQEPPVWHDYLTSAHQRMVAGDKVAAILDLAVATEARIRLVLDDKLPSGIEKGFKRVIRLQNITNVLDHWNAFGLPAFANLACIRTLFDIRNGIMHRGKEDRADATFFKSAAEAVAQLMAILA